jgi:2-oxoglutarate ferredoxin oxidoreductase subunit alpha
MILADGMLGQMMEPLEFDDKIKPPKEVKKPWALTGAEGREAQSIKSLFLKEGVLEELNERLQEKFRKIEKEEKKVETYMIGDAETIIVAYGTVSRIARACVENLRAVGTKIGLIRPITLWPFPYEEISRAAKKGCKFLVVEMNAGQMVEDVRLAVQDDSRVVFYGRTGGGIPSEEEIMKHVIPDPPQAESGTR